MRNLKDYIKIVEGNGGYDPTETPWGAVKRMTGMGDPSQLVPGMANPNVSTDPTLAAHKARVAQAQQAQAQAPAAPQPQAGGAAKARTQQPAAPQPAQGQAQPSAWDQFTNWATTPIVGGSDPKAATKWAQQQVGVTPDGKWGKQSDAALSKAMGGGQPAAQSGKAKSAGAGFVDQGKQFGFNTPEEVQQIQAQLKAMGYPIAVDGKFGPKTLAAYKQASSQMYGQEPGQEDPNQPAPRTYQQGQASQQDFSKDMAAAVGMPNPYAKAPAAAPQGSVFGPDGKVTGMPAAPQPAKKVVNYTESKELSDIIRLANLNKN